MEQWLPIVIIALALVFQHFPWVEVVVTYLALYVPWKMRKIMDEVRKRPGPPSGDLSDSLARLRSSLKNGPKK